MARASYDDQILENAQQMIEEGRRIFRYDSFGDEAFWGDQLKLHQPLVGSKYGGVGPGVSPRFALTLGLKVDADALAPELVQALQQGQGLDDPATMVAFLKQNAVLGLTGIFDDQGNARSLGVHCSFCHSTVDNSLAPGIGHRLDGWANRDLNLGFILSAAPNLKPLADELGTDVITVQRTFGSWGPGKFDPELFLDAKVSRPDRKPAASLIPPAFGLPGVNNVTWTGAWGSLSYWNALVAVNMMHGKGTFYDPRLNDPAQFPVAARLGFASVRKEPDLVTSKLSALQMYQLAMPAPTPPEGSFNKEAAERGDELFGGKARCESCHVSPIYTEPGWNLHTAAEIGIDDFQSSRAPEKLYRTSPLRGLWTHSKGGFYHDGRFATLRDVVEHYNNFFGLELTDQETGDLIEYLKSL
jgi:hypothetical protein